ncbi:universal stress protein [Pseudogemmobacter humi]|uniref:Universal stress protein family protein n=1 Tax=Pseudogemmobacter humi TaxID=2483812 RepID=A0A3P5X1U9_9RHOB|nr:universal stress protein [Pseudogemmobacter humi]VDC25201.1 Universal stress protein family protein [Pseudogemmobacter humi]
MAYKSLLTVASSAAGLPVAVDAAAKIALEMDAHLETLALGVDRSQLGYAYIGSGAMLMQVAMERAAEEVAANEAGLRAALSAQGQDLRWSIDSAVSQLGALSELVGARARYADLVVLPKPYLDGAGPEAEAVAEAAMFEGMAPVLIVPETGLASPVPKRIVLAWNQSREAMVTARRALPFLKRAEQVVITVVDPPAHGPERSDPGGMLCQLLVRHGVRAEVAVLARTLPRISEVLARQCQDLDADMLVMGAYGHSRFREAILGGATRNMLEQTKVPVLMAH